MFAAVGGSSRLLDAYRRGGGVWWVGRRDARESQADLNRPWYERSSPGPSPASRELDAPVAAGCRVADVGCGGGWSTIALARAYPLARLDGVDVDEPSVALARANAGGRARRPHAFHVATPRLASPGDRSTRPSPSSASTTCPDPSTSSGGPLGRRGPAARWSSWTRPSPRSSPPRGDDVDRLMYGYSVFVCLPDGLSSAPSRRDGDRHAPGDAARYAREAGFAEVEVLPIEDFGFLRFYRLVTPCRQPGDGVVATAGDY